MSLESLLVIKGPIADIPFELLQLMLIMHTIIWFAKQNKFINCFLVCTTFIMHMLRFFIYLPSILQNTNSLIFSCISLGVILYYIFNYFNIKQHKLKLGCIYAMLAIYHFVYNFNGANDNNTEFKKIYYFIPFTNMLGVCSWEYYNENIFPLIFGDYVYHLIDLIAFFSNKKGKSI